tara:strand:- start:98 stop:361 length:264 start_codon:yes stop_codon:yes gene_type:complete
MSEYVMESSYPSVDSGGELRRRLDDENGGSQGGGSFAVTTAAPALFNTTVAPSGVRNMEDNRIAGIIGASLLGLLFLIFILKKICSK